MWTLGIAILLVQTAFFAVTFLPAADRRHLHQRGSGFIPRRRGQEGRKRGAPTPPPYLGPKAAAEAAMHAAFKSTSVYAPSALALVLAGALCRATGDRKFQALALLRPRR